MKTTANKGLGPQSCKTLYIFTQPAQVNLNMPPFCEAQARVRQGLARDGSQGERPQSFNPCLELKLKLVATFPPTTQKFNFA